MEAALKALIICTLFSFVSSRLSTSFYDISCPQAQPIVRSIISTAINQERRIGASILRLFFHDCFVNGCDGSILLDDTPTFIGEKSANPNLNSIRGFDIIDSIKSMLETFCPRTVSCADILAMATLESVTQLGGPSWDLALGRKDSRSASKELANVDIPSPNSTLWMLLAKFGSKGLSCQDLSALSGAHTIGVARCATFRDRLYGFRGSNMRDPRMDPMFLAFLQSQCPKDGDMGKLVPLDFMSPGFFDNGYFKNVLAQHGVLNSDQELITGGGCGFVNTYASDPRGFFLDFANAMVKLGNLAPPFGFDGEVRINCHFVNGN